MNVVKESTPTGGHRHLYLYSASNERIATIELVGAQQQSEWTIRDDAGKVLRRFRKSLSGAWSWDEDYIYRGAQLLAAEVPGPEKVRHFHLDHLGTPRLITGNGGAVIAARTYGAFGRGLNVTSTPAPDEPAQFTGHERDNFQLDYMHARYYDPMMGRFLSVDPVLQVKRAMRNPQGWNRYAYVFNNPLKYTDPTGRVAELPSNCADQKTTCKELADLRNGVPVELRMFVRARTVDGKVVVDARYLNMKRDSASGNFQALRTIANSPGRVGINTSQTSYAARENGSLTTHVIGATSGEKGVTLETGGMSSVAGLTQVFVGSDMGAMETASTLAHELRHAMLFLLGKPWGHELGLFEESPGVFNVYDPNGPVNRATAAAEREAEANYDPFSPP